MPDRLLTIREVADRTGFSMSTLYKGGPVGLRRVRVGRSIRFLESDVEQWMRGLPGTGADVSNKLQSPQISPTLLYIGAVPGGGNSPTPTLKAARRDFFKRPKRKSKANHG